MDSKIIRNIFSLFDADVDYEESTTFNSELNRQCGVILVPTAIVAVLSWLPYIPLDRQLFPELTILPAFRLGFSLIGLVILWFHFYSPYKRKSYILLFILIGYVELATAVILGMVQANSAYMGGYSFLVLVLPLMPFKRSHSFMLMLSSFAVFIIFGLWSGLTFDSWEKIYGLYNLVGACVIASIAIFLLDNIRKVSFDRNRVNYITNMKLKVATMEIVQINEELKKADELKSKLLEIAAHDLKNPLQIIIACIELLQDEVQDNTCLEQLNIIYRSTDNMINLISRLLKSMSIESGQFDMKKTDTDISRIAEGVVRDLRLHAAKKNQEIILACDEHCIVYGDEMLLQEIFENLLSNAVKFSPHGKAIWVTVECRDDAVIYKVRDQGPGLSNTDKEKLFGRFQKLSAKPTGGESSSGLGLSIVKDLVEIHRGRLSVDSQLGQGSTFIVEFPRVGVEELKPRYVEIQSE